MVHVGPFFDFSPSLLKKVVHTKLDCFELLRSYDFWIKVSSSEVTFLALFIKSEAFGPIDSMKVFSEFVFRLVSFLFLLGYRSSCI